MTKMEREMAKLHMYRVYGHNNERVIDEYCEALSAQHAADRVREWFSSLDEEGGKVVIEEVAKVVKGWK